MHQLIVNFTALSFLSSFLLSLSGGLVDMFVYCQYLNSTPLTANNV